MSDPRKNPEVEVLEEGQHPDWILEVQTEGLDELQGERLEVEAKEEEEEEPSYFRYLIRRFYG